MILCFKLGSLYGFMLNIFIHINFEDFAFAHWCYPFVNYWTYPQMNRWFEFEFNFYEQAVSEFALSLESNKIHRHQNSRRINSIYKSKGLLYHSYWQPVFWRGFHNSELVFVEYWYVTLPKHSQYVIKFWYLVFARTMLF